MSDDNNGNNYFDNLSEQIIGSTLRELARGNQEKERLQLRLRLTIMGIDPDNSPQGIEEFFKLHLRHEQELIDIAPKSRHPAPGKHSWELDDLTNK
jgi:hypothetical protein